MPNNPGNRIIPSGDFSLIGSGYTVYYLTAQKAFPSLEIGQFWCIAGPSEPGIEALWREYSGEDTMQTTGQMLGPFVEWLRKHKGFVQFEQSIHMEFEVNA